MLSASPDAGVRVLVTRALIGAPITRCGGALANIMKINTLEFNASEAAALFALAGQKLFDQGKSREEAMAIIEKLSPQNLVRLALGFEPRNRGGKREGGFGPGYKSKRYCAVCKRRGQKNIVWRDSLCESCWHQSADAKAAMI